MGAASSAGRRLRSRTTRFGASACAAASRAAASLSASVFTQTRPAVSSIGLSASSFRATAATRAAGATGAAGAAATGAGAAGATVSTGSYVLTVSDSTGADTSATTGAETGSDAGVAATGVVFTGSAT